MNIEIAICLTLVASIILNVAIVLLKISVGELAGRRGHHIFMMLLTQTKNGWIGLTLLLVGYAIFLLAASAHAAPISVLRPLFTFGLVVVAVLAVVVLKERLSPLEWLGMGILLVGTILLSTSASSGSAPILHLYRLLLFLAGSAVVCMLILGCSLVLKVQHAEFAFGTIVGLLFGSGYLATKTVFLAWQENRSMLAALAFLAMGAGMLGGLAVLLWSFRRGRALIIRGVNFVVNQVMVVLGGAYCLGESFPEEPLLLLARFAGFAAIVLGALLLLAAGRKSPVGAA